MRKRHMPNLPPLLPGADSVSLFLRHFQRASCLFSSGIKFYYSGGKRLSPVGFMSVMTIPASGYRYSIFSMRHASRHEQNSLFELPTALSIKVSWAILQPMQGRRSFHMPLLPSAKLNLLPVGFCYRPFCIAKPCSLYI